MIIEMGDLRAEIKPVHSSGHVTGFRWAITTMDVPNSVVESGVERDFDTAFLRAEAILKDRRSHQAESE